MGPKAQVLLVIHNGKDSWDCGLQLPGVPKRERWEKQDICVSHWKVSGRSSPWSKFGCAGMAVNSLLKSGTLPMGSALGWPGSAWEFC